jgi:Flp pilus assembly protein TadD
MLTRDAARDDSGVALMTSDDEGRRIATRAVRALRGGRKDEAQALVRRVLAIAPDDPKALYTASEVTWALDDASTTELIVERAIAHEKERPPAGWHLRLARARARQGKIDDALQGFRTVVALAPEDAEALGELAELLASVGDVGGSIEAWRRVVGLVPNDWQAKNELGMTLMEMGDMDGAEAAFAAARALAPDEVMIVVNRSTLDVRRGRAADAVALLEPCVEHHPEFAPARAGLGYALRELGRFEEAAAELRRALALLPDDATLACGLSRTLLEGGAAEEASAVAQGILRRRPGHAGALAAEALARRALGDVRAVEALVDHERLVVRVTLTAPEGYADLVAFNRALAEHIESHPTLRWSPASHATKEGRHSGSLLVSPRGPIAAFEQALRTAVGDYWKNLPELPGHPFVGSRPKAGFFNVWSVVLGRGGHQIQHIHPSAWLSGVYYAKVPEAVSSGDDLGGWLEFGDAERAFPSRLPPKVVTVRPVEGLLVLFPSYFFHRTIPFDAAGTRVSIAFDLMPAP